MIPLHDDNPTKHPPIMTIGLIVLNSLIFLFQMSLDPQEGELFIYRFGAIPGILFGSYSLPASVAVIPSSLSVLTSMFLHGGLLHLAGNMLYLWIFGNNVEDAMGHFRFLVFYLLTGVFAFLGHFLTDINSTIPTIGASGAISGVLGAYILLFPRAQVLVFIFLGIFIRMMYIPAGIVLGFYLLIQLFQGVLTWGQAGGGVAWFAHIGGFSAGLILVGLFKKQSVPFFNPPHYHASRIHRWQDRNN